MGIFERLTAEQVTAFYQLVQMLRRLKVIGVLHAKTVPAVQEVDVLGNYDVIDMTLAIYGIKKLGYSKDKTMVDVEERLNRMFRTKRLISLRGVP